jgi:hypothetical protein
MSLFWIEFTLVHLDPNQISLQFVQQLQFPFLPTRMPRMQGEFRNLIPSRHSRFGLKFEEIIKYLASNTWALCKNWIDLIFWLFLATLAMNALLFSYTF